FDAAVVALDRNQKEAALTNLFLARHALTRGINVSNRSQRELVRIDLLTAFLAQETSRRWLAAQAAHRVLMSDGIFSLVRGPGGAMEGEIEAARLRSSESASDLQARQIAIWRTLLQREVNLARVLMMLIL